MKLKNEYETENKIKHISTFYKNVTFLAKLSWESNWSRWYKRLFVIINNYDSICLSYYYSINE